MQNKKALVTGASEGIGRAFAKKLAQEGYTITAVARNESRLKELVGELTGASHVYQTADLASEEGIEKISTELRNTHYDLLVNNAGFSTFGAFAELTLAENQKMIRVNCEALVAFSHAFLKNAKAGDTLINVSSVLGFLPMPAQGIYAATKAFVTSFSESLWHAQRSKGVYVMGLCPGTTRTEFANRAGGDSSKLPKVGSQSSEEVVEVAMKALKYRTEPIVVTSTLNTALVSLPRLLSRKLLVKIMGQIELK